MGLNLFRKRKEKSQKKSKLFISLVLIMFVLVPSVAASKEGRVGERISMWSASPIKFAANKPFHIAHGWVNETNITGVGLFKFSLDVDGFPVKADFVERSAISGDPDVLRWTWVFNFPNGMTGTHTLIGHWTGSCQGLVDMHAITGPCNKPTEIIESTHTLVIEFFQ